MERHDRRLTTARWLGIAGGSIGIVIWFLAVLTALVGDLFSELTGADLWLLWGAFIAALLFPVLGVVGGFKARARPKAAAVYLGIAGIGSLLMIPSLWLVFGPFLVAGAVLAWLGRAAVPVETSE